MKKIGIIGRGFVGSAVEFGFSAQTGCDAEVRIYDKDPTKSIHTLEETVNKSDFIFLSVPTPSNVDGSMHLGILESVLRDIQVVNKRRDNIILIRSTIIPGTTAKLCKKFTNLNIVFNPEFLTERSAKFDFINKCGVDWDMAVEGFIRDGRIGYSHMSVPGPDGRKGFGGSCFPKDIQAMINFGENLNINMNTLKGVWSTNLEVRPERDWEKLEGRAIIKK